MEQEKQEKILKKIKHTTNSGQKTPLGTKPNDECYTSMDDIIQELTPWGDLNKFKGKNIICPCDWDIIDGQDIYSITIEYSNNGVDIFGNAVKKAEIKYDLWSDSTIETIQVAEDEIDEFLRDKLTCNFLRTLTQNARHWGIKSITASGYNPANGKGIRFQDIDYSNYDVCITNPPFSLYGEFMKAIVGKLDFIVLAPFLNRVTPSVGLPLMLNKAFIGWNIGDMGNMQFYNPTSQNKYKTKTVACDWIVSYPEAQQARNIENHKTGIKYDVYKDEYQAMLNMTMKDGTHPIRVPATAYPEDYDGWMFTSIQILNKLNTDEYEWYGTNFGGYYNKSNPAANPFAHKASNKMLILDNKTMFHGIIFRRKIKNNS